MDNFEELVERYKNELYRVRSASLNGEDEAVPANVIMNADQMSIRREEEKTDHGNVPPIGYSDGTQTVEDRIRMNNEILQHMDDMDDGEDISAYQTDEEGVNRMTRMENQSETNAMNNRQQSMPQQSTPQQTMPQQSTPQQATPQQSMPQQTMPQQTMPQQAMPQQTMPQQSMPQQTMPQRPTPQQTMPQQTMPQQSMPQQTMPQQTMPQQPMPQQSMPQQPMPQQSMPQQPMPQQPTSFRQERQPSEPSQRATEFFAENTENIPGAYGTFRIQREEVNQAAEEQPPEQTQGRFFESNESYMLSGTPQEQEMERQQAGASATNQSVQQSPSDLTAQGYAQFFITTARRALPMPGASITLTRPTTNDNWQKNEVADESGTTRRLALPTVDYAKSTQSGNQPYTEYNYTVEKEGFYPVSGQKMPIYETITTIQQIDMVPLPLETEEGGI